MSPAYHFSTANAGIHTADYVVIVRRVQGLVRLPGLLKQTGQLGLMLYQT